MRHLAERAPVRRATAAALFIVLLLPAAAHGLDLNGFLPRQGEGAAALSYTTESYDHFWRGTQKVQTPGGLGQVDTDSLSLWLRWGLSDRLSVVANLPYVDVATDGTAGFGDSGLGDLEAGLMLRALERSNGPWRHRLVAGVGLRTPASDYVGDAPVSLGDDSTDALLRLIYQLERGGFYLSQQLGFDARGDGVPDAFPLYTEAGYTWGRLTGSGFLSVLFADDGTDIGDPGFTFPSNREEYTRIGGKLYARLTGRLGASLAAFTTLDGRNTGETTGVSAGVVLDF